MDDETRQAVKETVEETIEKAEEAVKKPFVKRLARFGFYTKGVLFIIIGALAILLVMGLRGGKITDPAGALGTVGQQPFGKVFLLAFIVGALGHGFWNILRGAADVDDAGKNWIGIIKRVIPIGIGIFYIGLALTAWGILLTGNVSNENGRLPRTLTSVLLALPAGVIVVLIIGLSMIGAGFHECYSGISGKFQEHYRSWEIKGPHQSFITVLGVLSFTARALIFVLMGWFFITAAINFDADIAAGLDGALVALARSSYGEILLFVTAIGLVCHGILAFYEARYRRIC
jgi:hypothetical protein